VKGIILAGGKGTRLFPATLAMSKQLLPVYDKPLIYYPLSTLMLAGIREILIVCAPKDLSSYKELFGDGGPLGLDIRYAIQENPNGIAEALIIGEGFTGEENVALILGDNLFHGVGFGQQLQNIDVSSGAVIFATKVSDPSSYGVVEFDEKFRAISIEEKPESPKSDYAIPGLYFYGPKVAERAKNLLPSSRGELEISDLNLTYLRNQDLSVHIMPRGTVWLDTGTSESLHSAAEYVKLIEQRQGMKIACIEEIAYLKGWIDKQKLITLITQMPKCTYREYLDRFVEQI
jgi:glucose-1-phosphate thymidylyltransferase